MSKHRGNSCIEPPFGVPKEDNISASMKGHTTGCFTHFSTLGCCLKTKFPGFSFWKRQGNLSLLPCTCIPRYAVILLVGTLNKLALRRHVDICLHTTYIYTYKHVVLVLFNRNVEKVLSSKKKNSKNSQCMNHITHIWGSLVPSFLLYRLTRSTTSTKASEKTSRRAEIFPRTIPIIAQVLELIQWHWTALTSEESIPPRWRCSTFYMHFHIYSWGPALQPSYILYLSILWNIFRLSCCLSSWHMSCGCCCCRGPSGRGPGLLAPRLRVRPLRPCTSISQEGGLGAAFLSPLIPEIFCTWPWH